LKHSEFVHLHLHSQYSLLDGAIHFKPLLQRAEELKMPAIAVTDHGSMFGALEFFSAAMKSPVKPIIGCEVYVAPSSRFEKTPISSESGYDKSFHLVLLVMDSTGYKNLSTLVSAGYTEGFYYKPRLDKELLEKHNEGLIALSACLGGEVPKMLALDRMDKAREAAGFYKEVFKDRFYLEMQDHGIHKQQEVNKKMIPFSKKMELPLVATNDAHYLRREDAEAHDALLCIGTGKFINDENRMRYEGDQLYVKSAEEMEALFGDVPDALKNTIRIAEELNFKFNEGKYHLPKFKVPSDTNIANHLESLAINGLEKRIFESKGNSNFDSVANKKDYMARLKEELAIIIKMGFAGYFLITADFINYARNSKIPVGPGRGSAAGSMVAYALRITDLDPIKYGLIFERFLNPERISLPDIDIDFCMERRGEVIDYVREKYGGASHVAQIITFGTMKAKAVVRDVARVMEIPYAHADKIAKLIPNENKMTVDKALEEEPRLRVMQSEDQKVEKLLRISKSLEGTVRHASTHAAGVVVSPEPLINFMPIYKHSGGEITTQFQMKDVEKLGLLKMDFLGLRTLTVISNCQEMIRRNHQPGFSIAKIDLDDAKSFELLCSAKTLGVFQLESSGMRDLIRKMKPTTFQDIIALVALFRPGPIQSGMADQYVKRKHGHENVEFEFEELEPILGETFGVMVYQEQVMKIANVLSGFSLGEADELRKAMGKKNMDIMAEVKTQFVDGATNRGHNKTKVETLWSQMEKFGEYGFNKSHSACYALLAYQTAYLKSHFAAEFMAALISSEMDNSDKVLRYIQECRDSNILVTPPDINQSKSDFAVIDGTIRFGIAAVKGIGSTAANSIVLAREQGGEFQSLVDFAERVDSSVLNKRTMEALIKCGAFDYTGYSRRSLFENLGAIVSASQKAQHDREIGQTDIFSAMGAESSEPGTIKITRFDEWNERERLAHEKSSLGFFISGHPLNEFSRELKRLATYDTSSLEGANHKAKVHIGGIIIGKRVRLIRNGERMANLILEDLKGTVEVIVWPDVFTKFADEIDSEEPIFVNGQADVDDEKGTKIIAQEIYSIPTARTKFTNMVRVKFSTTGLEKETLEELNQIFVKSSGPSTVILEIRVPGLALLDIKATSTKVSASEELVKKIESLIGEDTVIFE